MFKKDIDVLQKLFSKYNFKAPLLDAGGLADPVIADYDISVAKAIPISVKDEYTTRSMYAPHSQQNDRYLNIHRPWEFIDPDYVILNPDKGDPKIENLDDSYNNKFETLILVSVFEHIENPYVISDHLFRILKAGGFLFNSTPFLFPYHPSPEDNFRYSPLALRRIHEKSGFEWLEGDFHVNYSTAEGIGDSNPNNYAAPQAIMASYALCRKP